MTAPTEPIRPDCESCGGDAVSNRYDEHNGWQPICASCAYLARCEDAARRQGLTEPAELLTAAGIEHRYDQTGGFVMVLAVDAGPDACIWITRDGVEDEPYLFGLYGIDHGVMDDEPTGGYRTAPLADVADVVAEMLAAPRPWNNDDEVAR